MKGGEQSGVGLTKGSLLYQLANRDYENRCNEERQPEGGLIDHVVARVGFYLLGQLGGLYRDQKQVRSAYLYPPCANTPSHAPASVSMQWVFHCYQS